MLTEHKNESDMCRILSRRFSWKSTVLAGLFAVTSGVGAILHSGTMFQALAREIQPSADDLLREADKARGGDVLEGLAWTVRIESREGKAAREQTYQIQARADYARVECISPEKCRGEILLVQGAKMWFYKPTLKRPIAISSRQRLTGNAAHGDVAMTQFSRDYRATLLGSDALAGTPAWKLELKPKTADATYDGIRVWVGRENGFVLRAEFLSLRGEVLKAATYTYDNNLLVEGKSRPFISKIVIVDSKFADHVTTMITSDPKVEAQLDSVFELSRLGKKG